MQQTKQGPFSEIREEIGNVVTSVRGKATDTKEPRADVNFRTVERVDQEALNRLEQKIAKEIAAIDKAQRSYSDQISLQKEALALADNKERMSADALNLLKTKKQLREKLLQEERELEKLRADKHAQAVAVEGERAETKARSHLLRKEAEVTRDLAKQHMRAAKQYQALVDAHRLAMSELEKKREYLRRPEIDVEVIGSEPSIPQPVDIDVRVRPKHLAEAHIGSSGAVKGGEARAHIEEKLPTRATKEIPARSVGETQERRKEEHHVITK